MKKLFLCWALLLGVMAAGAMPAKPGQKKMLKLGNGTTVEARLVGDEHGHYWLATDGKAFKKVKGTDFYAEVDANSVVEKASKRRAKANAKRHSRLAPKNKKKAAQVCSYNGSKKGLIILVEYQDVKFQPENNQALFNRIANETNFSEGEFVGSVHDYFLAQSEGLFDLTFDVVGPYPLANDRAYYGENADTETAEDLRAEEMIVEACKMADADVNFADYDWDGDGEVDQVFVLYAGNGEANYGDEDSVWPHEWTLSGAQYYGANVSPLKLDGVTIDTYACSNELQPKQISKTEEVLSWKIEGIGTICHEFSHCLGYPDFYDTNYQNSGMGYWELMDAGSYNGEGYCPAGFTSYERWVAGWKEPVELTEDTEVSAMKALQNGGDTYIIYNDGNKNEYFLLENRQWTGWDEELPGSGLLILHVDYNENAWWNNEVNTTKNHERMTWIAADNKKKYETYEGARYYDFYDMENDPYPYKSNNSFSNTSTPAATLFNKNTDGTKKLNKSVTDITQNSDGTISFMFKTDSSGETPDPTGSGTYKRITDTNQLNENDEYLIVYEASETKGTAYAGFDGSKNIGKKVDITIDGYTTNGSSAQKIKLEQAEGNNWYILDGENYLYFTGSSNKLYASATKGNSGFAWIISTSDITNADYSERKLQYNTAANGLRFACYTGSQKDVVLYVNKQSTSIFEKPTVSSEVSTREIYDLQGRSVSEKATLQRGIYIVNGRKVVIK